MHVLHVSWSLCTDCSSWKEPGSPKQHESRVVTSQESDALLTTKPRVKQLIRSTKRSKRRLYRALIRLWSACRNCEVVRGTSKVGSTHDDSHYTSGLRSSYVFRFSHLFQISVLTISCSTLPCLGPASCTDSRPGWTTRTLRRRRALPNPSASIPSKEAALIYKDQTQTHRQKRIQNQKVWYLKLSQMSRNWQFLCTVRRQAELWNLPDLPFPKSLHPIGQKIPRLKALGDRASGTCP